MDSMEHENDAEDIPNNTSEDYVQRWRRLIELVKPNQILYHKKLKGSDKKINKMQMWNDIGASMVPQLPGVTAEREFYRLRQKFGKERRKLKYAMMREGSGADHRMFKSSWVLYDDLMFLTNHIQPRRRTLIYQTPIMDIPCTPTPPLTSDEKTSYQNHEFYDSLADSESTTVEEERLSSTANTILPCYATSLVQIKPSTSFCNESMVSPTLHASPSEAVESRQQNTAEGNGLVNSFMLESLKNMTSLAKTLETTLRTTKSQGTAFSDWNPAVQGMMGSIAVGLSKVPENYQMECLIAILSCINTFLKK